MTIKILVGIDDCTLAVYCCPDKAYRFSVVNAIGQIYTCNSSFPTLSSARLMGTSAIKRLALDCE